MNRRGHDNWIDLVVSSCASRVGSGELGGALLRFSPGTTFANRLVELPNSTLIIGCIFMLGSTLVGCGGSSRSSTDDVPNANGAAAGLASVPTSSAGTTSGAGGSGSAGEAAPGGAAATPSDGGATAEPFCTKPLSDCSMTEHFLLRPDASYCTLSEGISAMCAPCGEEVAPCFIGTGIVHGADYTYLDILNVDAGSRLVYDASGALVAVLGFGANASPPWRCQEGPNDFDPTEAMANPMKATIGTLRDTCEAEAP